MSKRRGLDRTRRRSSRSKSLKRSAKPGKRIVQVVEGQLDIAAGGYGFVRVLNTDIQEDVFIPQSKLRGALSKDMVKAAVIKKVAGKKALKQANSKDTKSYEGEIVEIIRRSNRPYVGILQIVGGQAYVIIESKNMPYDIELLTKPNIRKEQMELLDSAMKYKPLEVKKEYQGMKVAALVLDFPKNRPAPVGVLVDVLGNAGDNNTEMHAILTEFGLPFKFPDEVEAAADAIPKKITAKDIKGRRDFRKDCVITIDPADAKDFDDAVSLRKLDNGHCEVGIHIADVSYYVRPGTLLDKEAYNRATSVYLVDRTIPMLPEALSNNLCSLRPGEDKLTFSAVFEMDDKGKVYSSWFGRSIICSAFRFAYEEAQQIIDNKGDISTYTPVLAGSAEGINTRRSRHSSGGKEITNDVTGLTTAAPPRPVVEMVLHLHQIASVLRQKRFKDGSVNFERPEMKVLVDENGKPVNVIQKVTQSANWMIEELMLLANKGVATFVAKEVAKKLSVKAPTFVYRIHDEPNMEKVEQLRSFIHHFGYKLGPSDTPLQLAKSLNRLLEALKDKPENDAVTMLALRCMARAEYSTDNIGHYGLGFRYYTHFTSPIRRYPDTMVHRLLAWYLEGGKSADKRKYEEYCKHSSEREQLATDAERASVKYKMVEFMQDKVGQTFTGTVSGLADWGIYVQIAPTMIEGMVPLREMADDYYQFDEENYCVTGKATHKKYTLGDVVKVKAVRTNLEQKTIDFELIEK